MKNLFEMTEEVKNKQLEEIEEEYKKDGNLARKMSGEVGVYKALYEYIRKELKNKVL